ncbi:MAG: endolytic transglycosylase MltG [Anaerolineales bacterium]
MRKRKWIRRSLLLFVIGGMCLGAAAVGLLAGYVPDMLGKLGRPAPDLRPHELAYLSGYLALHQGELTSPVNPTVDEVEIVVPEGATAREVAAQLQQGGLLKDPQLLVSYLRYRGLDRGVEAGAYLLQGDMNLRQIAQELQSATPRENLFTVPEGWRSAQIVQALDQQVSSELAAEFSQASDGRPDGYSFSSELPADGGLEGFLFPDTYQLRPETTGVELATMMLDNFERRVARDLRNGFEAQGLSLYEAVTLASIVEREAAVAEERPRIASVFLNRLALGMKLEADPTVQYALGQMPDGSWWKRGLTNADLEMNSPYNTYLIPGLPPTPIANPGLDSLRAVAFPESTDFLYFRAACDGSGSHRFAKTFEEHVANACP